MERSWEQEHITVRSPPHLGTEVGPGLKPRRRLTLRAVACRALDMRSWTFKFSLSARWGLVISSNPCSAGCAHAGPVSKVSRV